MEARLFVSGVRIGVLEQFSRCEINTYHIEMICTWVVHRRRGGQMAKKTLMREI